MKTNAGKLQEQRLWSLPSSPLFENTGWNYTPEHLQFDGASNAKGTRTRPGHTGRLWVKNWENCQIKAGKNIFHEHFGVGEIQSIDLPKILETESLCQQVQKGV